MARQDGKRERQHYVPQILLKPFSFKGKGKVPQVYVFDKGTEKSFQTGIDNILAEHKFYDVFEGSAEPIISELEGYIAPIFKKLIENKNVKELSPDEKHWIAVFVASQHLRSKGFRLRHKDFEEALLKKLKSNGQEIDENLAKTFMLDDEDTKEFSIQFFARNLASFSDTLLTKIWHLLETTPDKPFCIGDNPMVMHNDNDLSPYGNIGLMVLGIQIYMPLSPTLLLGMWCPTIKDAFEKELMIAKRNLSQAQIANVLATRPSNVLDKESQIHLRNSVRKLEEMLKLQESGLPIMCTDQHIIFYNSLQIGWSDKYIISNENDFALVKRMLSENPIYKKGVKFKMD